MLASLVKYSVGALVDLIIVAIVWRLWGTVAAFLVGLHLVSIELAWLLGGKPGLATTVAHWVIIDWGWLFGRSLFDGQAIGIGLGLLLLSLPAILLFWTGLAVLSYFTLPVSFSGWTSAADCLVGFITGYHYPYWVVKGNQIEQRAGGKLMRRGLYPGLLVNNAYSAVPLSTGTGFSRVAGPGVTFTRRAERPLQDELIDLRTQARSGKVQATTRDGIDVQFNLPVIFTIDRWPLARPPVMVAPYSESAVFNAVRAQRASQDRELQWDEIPLELAKNIARNVVGGYLFDRLLEDETQAQSVPPEEVEQTADRRRRLALEHRAKMPRDTVREEINEQLKEEVKRLDYGIRIIGVGLGNMEVVGASEADRKKALQKPKSKEEAEEIRIAQERVRQAEELRKAILGQRVGTWQSEWLAESVRRRANSEAEAARVIGRARAEAQMRMIQALNEGFSQAREKGVEVPSDLVVLLRLLDALEEMCMQPDTRENLSEEALHTQAIMKRAAQRAAGG